jgi:hypothetical protein
MSSIHNTNQIRYNPFDPRHPRSIFMDLIEVGKS